MKKSDYDKLLEFVYKGGGFIPYNQNAMEYAHSKSIGEVVVMADITARDLAFHRCYFSLLSYIWGFLPQKFQETIPENKFYNFLKHLKGEYDVIFEFNDGTRMIEYESISFGKMSNDRFKEYIKEQLPYIYANVIGQFYEGEIYDGIIQNIEDEYEKFMSKLK